MSGFSKIDSLPFTDHPVKGDKYRRKNGKVIYEVDQIFADYSYQQSYGFINYFIRLRHPDKPKRTEFVAEPEFRYGWVYV